MLQIKRYTATHIEESIELLHALYLDEREHHTTFLSFDFTKDILKQLLENLSKHSDYGYALFDDDEFVGFIIGHVIPSLWGKYDGFYSPLHANAMKKPYRKKGYQYLYQHMAQDLVSNNILSHAITLHTNDDVSMNTWFHLGFGLRLIDSLKPIDQTSQTTLPNTMNIQRITKENTKDILPLHKKLHFYFEQSPLFMPQSEEDESKDILAFINHEDQYMYGLYQQGQAVALMKLKQTGENYLTQDKNAIHICGLYVDEQLRNQGIASTFLDSIETIFYNMGYTLMGVDFESFNIKGANFWHKYFTPYTYTLTRRIDENILKRN